MQAEVLTVDRRVGAEARDLFPEWALAAAIQLGIQNHLAGDIANRQVARDAGAVFAERLDAGADERNRRKFLSGEEVSRTQVTVASAR